MPKTLTTGITVAFLALTQLAQPAPPLTWDSRGVGGGGALFSPALSPHTGSELYVGCDMSQLFHSNDLGRTWSQADFRAVQSFHESKVQFTSDPKVLYTIDYTSQNRVDYMRPVKSGDSGLTWNPLPGDPTGGTDAYRVVADPNRVDRVLLTDWNTLYISSDGGQSFAARYSGRDNGVGLILSGTLWSGNDIYVGTNDGILHSSDGGQSFAALPIGGIPASEMIISVAVARTGAMTRFVAITYDRSASWNGMQGWDHWGYRNVYVVDLGQSSWRMSTNGIAAGHHPFIAGMARANVSIMWLAGGSDSSVPTIYRSVDGGLSWTNTFLATGNLNIATGWSGNGGDRDWSYGEVALGFDVSPINPEVAVYTDYGFVHATADGGATWRQAYVDPQDENPRGQMTPRRRAYHGVGIEDTTSWCLAWSSLSELFACFSDIRGIRSTDAGTSWSFDYSGHTDNSMYWVVRHPSSGVLYGATSSVHDMYQSTYLQDSRIDNGSGSVRWSSDAGLTWQLLHNFGHPVIWVALDPTRPNRLYAAVIHSTQGGIFRSDDINRGAASTWVRVSSPPRTEGHPFNVVVLKDGTVLSTYSGRRNPGGAFTPSSGVFVSSDGGQTWLDRSHPGMHYWTRDIVVDPHDPAENTWYVGVWGGWGGAPNTLGGLYRSRDRGLSWTRTLVLDRVSSLAVSPTDPNEAYLTTGVDGLWVSSDFGSQAPTWTVTSYPFRQPERVFFNPYDPTEVWVTSFGNGLRVGRSNAQAQLLLRAALVSVSPRTPAFSTIFPFNPTNPAIATVANPFAAPTAVPVVLTSPLELYQGYPPQSARKLLGVKTAGGATATFELR